LPSCNGCVASIRSLDALDRDDSVLTGGRITIRTAKIDHRQFTFHADFVIDVEFDEQAVIISRPTTAPSTASTAVSGHHTLLFLRWVSGGWKVGDVTPR
jgi:hypothetical protein